MTNELMSSELMSGDFALYIHWPFCLSKCPYCDFNAHVSRDIDHGAWRAAYLEALSHYAQEFPELKRVGSVYFGGGTPSLMAPQTVEAILEALSNHWVLDADIEITLEANPTSVEFQKFADFRAAGINRVSLGIQSLRDEDLKFLGRKHSVKEAIEAIDTARKNFDRFSFDLIYARPNQTHEDWDSELREALTYAGGHLSLYQLTIERSTPFYMAQAQGAFVMPKDDLAADFYHLTQDIMEEAGLPAYEVSNHAATGQESRHNLTYWRYGDYIGIGPGAHGRLSLGGQKFATRDHSAPKIWLKKVAAQGSGAHPFTPLSQEDQFFEALMMGLRMSEGLDLDHISRLSGVPWRDRLNEAHLHELGAQGWAVQKGAHLTLTREGLLRLNAIIPYILKSPK